MWRTIQPGLHPRDKRLPEQSSGRLVVTFLMRALAELPDACGKVQEEVSQAYAEAERALEMLRQEGEAEEMAAE